MRTLAIGDIHGCLTALKTMDEAVGFSEGDRIISLGDYVDRGPDSKGVIEYLIALRERCDVVTLRGNHEIMMEQGRGNNPTGWLSVGGYETMESYGAETLDDIPDAHWEFMRNCRPYFETETHIFVHAGVIHDLPMVDQPDYMLYWGFFEDPLPHYSGKTMVCGHSSQKSGVPLNIGHAICIDTWACGGKWLTCLDVDSGVYWQTNEKAATRQDGIAGCLQE
jgi:serine/threonine protein phosphatase 1